MEGLNDDLGVQLTVATFGNYQELVDKAILLEGKHQAIQNRKRKYSNNKFNSGPQQKPRTSYHNMEVVDIITMEVMGIIIMEVMATIIMATIIIMDTRETMATVMAMVMEVIITRTARMCQCRETLIRSSASSAERWATTPMHA